VFSITRFCFGHHSRTSFPNCSQDIPCGASARDDFDEVSDS
jgi:hypothetical protein